jgi:hypothetical protein
MKPIRLADEKLLVPHRVTGPNGLIGDVMVEIGPDDPDYEASLAYLALCEEAIEITRVDRASEEAATGTPSHAA